MVLLAATVGLSIWVYATQDTAGLTLAVVLMILSLVYGVSFVAPIGGADMPVVISLLNSITGLSAAAAGLIYNNQLMLVGGILVGAAGTILTVLMCSAMNRSLINVIIGGFGGGASSAKSDGEQVAREVSISDAAIQLYYSKSVVFVPGYGLAVAQAQKVCKELDDMLEANGVDVKYAIHPVAGRMPGHMNVLLAEADVPYPKLLDLDDANNMLPNTDVVVIVGANDVVNPAAKDDPGSPIYGMPVLNVWEAKHIIVMKRSMSPGYAGIQNPLFFHQKNKMLFGDAKKTLQALVSEVKTL
jgi:NAD(P) transhydrogenase subunit beta